MTCEKCGHEKCGVVLRLGDFVKASMVVAVLTGASATVGGLLGWSGPSAITGLVMPVVVDSIERLALRPLSHVGVEVREVQPPITHLDSPRRVSFVPGGATLAASVEHRVPSGVGGGAAQPVCRIQRISGDEGFGDGAAATNSVSPAQVCAGDNRVPAAVAPTEIVGLSVSLFGHLDDTQATEPRSLWHFYEGAFRGHV